MRVIIEGKSVTYSSCYLPKDSDISFNLWDLFIYMGGIDTSSSWHMLVGHSLQWGNLSICMDSCDVEPTLHVITVYLFEGLYYLLHFSVVDMVYSCKACIPAEGEK